MASDSSGPTSRIYFSQRLRLHYVDWGNPGAPPLVLLHGGRDHCRNWDWIATALRHDWHILAPDLRGHGDSQWSADGNYAVAAFIYDLAQLIHQQKLAPVTIIGHSLGGNIALRYSGIYPDNVRRLVAIEGVGASPEKTAERARVPLAERMQEWIEDTRRLSGRLPRRYPSIDYGMPQTEIDQLWARIACPTLLVYGKESRAANPQTDGRLRHFRHARVVSFDGAGHWVHHDQLEGFLDLVRGFL